MKIQTTESIETKLAGFGYLLHPRTDVAGWKGEFCWTGFGLPTAEEDRETRERDSGCLNACETEARSDIRGGTLRDLRGREEEVPCWPFRPSFRCCRWRSTSGRGCSGQKGERGGSCLRPRPRLRPWRPRSARAILSRSLRVLRVPVVHAINVVVSYRRVIESDCIQSLSNLMYMSILDVLLSILSTKLNLRNFYRLL